MAGSVIVALRRMSTIDIKTVRLNSLIYGSVNYNETDISIISNAIKGVDASFYESYNENVSKSAYTFEDVFDKFVKSHFDYAFKLKGFDVVYDDVTVHLRIVVDGVDDRIVHKSATKSIKYITSCMGSTMIVTVEEFKTTPTDVWREYYVTL